MANEDGWYGFDLDGCLAEYHRGDYKTYGHTHVGDPIEPMVNKVKALLAAGKNVKIMTARVSNGNTEAIAPIEEWCEQHIGQKLEITCIKDMEMISLHDDRAVQVISNEGYTMEDALFNCREQIMELNRTVEWLIDFAHLWSEEGTFTFPDGTTWHK